MYKEYPEKEVCIMVDDANEIKSKIYDLLVSLIKRCDNKEYAIDEVHTIIEYVEQLDDIINHLDCKLEKRDEMIDSLVEKIAQLPHKGQINEEPVNGIDYVWRKSRNLPASASQKPIKEGIKEINNFLARQMKVEEALDTLEEVLE